MRPSLYRPGVAFPELESCFPGNKGCGDQIQLDLNLPVINWVRRSDRQPRATPGRPKSVVNKISAAWLDSAIKEPILEAPQMLPASVFDLVGQKPWSPAGTTNGLLEERNSCRIGCLY
jgi:hypothetical protein